MEKGQDRALWQATSCLPPAVQAVITQAAERQNHPVEEIRLRVGGMPTLRTAGQERKVEGMDAVDPELLREILSRAARYSVHSYAESLRHGFLTLDGGHRLGLCGTAVMNHGAVDGMRSISSINLRIARQMQMEESVVRIVLAEEDRPRSLLIVSPPGFGKTTLLREMIRYTSDRGHAVSIADERSELAALSGGMPQFELGPCTDVIEGCSKREAAIMLLKTMSPALLALDEITSPEDVQAVSLCAHCGVAVLASAHAADTDDLQRRPLYCDLLRLNLFQYIVIISIENKRRKYRVVEWKGEDIC